MRNILLVDDDTVCTFVSSKLLEKIGNVNVRIAANGEDALALFEQYYAHFNLTPDIILLDLNMPVMDGFEFLEHFAAYNIPNKETIRIIVLTSSQNPDDVHRAKQLGVNRFLTKPLLEKDLREILTF